MPVKIFVTSGKGGVGKSTVTALLGFSLAKLGKKVLIVELDFGLRSLDVILGLQDRTIFDLHDVLISRCDFEKAVLTCDYEPNLDLISASLDSCASYDKNSLKKFFDKLDQNPENNLYKKYDYILIDSPAGIGQGFQEVLGLIDEALIVVTPDVVCVRDACKVSQILSEKQVENQKLVINKLKPDFAKLDMLPHLDYIIDSVGIPLVSVIAEDINISKFSSKGLKLPKNSQTLKIFERFAQRLLGQDIPLLIS